MKPGLNNKLLLVVEDNEINQKLFILMLEHIGYKADSASNGKEALEMLSKNKYDLVFMDVQMPEMDGFEATHLIRTLPETTGNRDVPILAITAHVSNEYKKRCLDSGMNDYMEKPIRLNDLDTMLKQWCLP